MNYEAYVKLFEKIITSENPPAPYNNPDYLNYAKLNYTRMNRLMKTMRLDESLEQMLKNIDEKQHWIIIVEPWCGDVAHSLPFLIRLAEQSPLITYDLQLRDSEPYLINSYLTKGTKSIPKLIVRNKEGNDLFVWGARPKAAQELMENLKASHTDFETIKVALQNWYNEDKGKSLQKELKELLSKVAA